MFHTEFCQLPQELNKLIGRILLRMPWLPNIPSNQGIYTYTPYALMKTCWCLHICMYVYMYSYACVYKYRNICILIWGILLRILIWGVLLLMLPNISSDLGTCMYFFLTCKYQYLFEPGYIYVIFMYTCKHVGVYIYLFTHVYAEIHIYTYAHRYRYVYILIYEKLCYGRLGRSIFLRTGKYIYDIINF